MEYILTDVQGYGWLCKIVQEGKERYRGEFRRTYTEAMEAALDWQEING